MARISTAVCKLCRREGMKLFLKGERCNTKNCAAEKKAYPPGQHRMTRTKPSEYRLRLREKQRARRIYGINERQFRRYFEIAETQSGSTGENLLKILESRLDNVVFRMGFAPSRSTARQLVRHGHILVNGKKVNIPSSLVSGNAQIAVEDKSKSNAVIKESVGKTKERANIQSWLEVNLDNLTGKVLHLPSKDEMASPLQEQLIVEFYSGK